MQTWECMVHKMPGNCFLGCVFKSTDRQALCATFLVHLTLKSCTCSTWATGMGSPVASLAATLVAGLTAFLAEALA